MKNIDISAIEQYNQNGTGKTEVYNFLQGNIIHLEEDITRFTKKGKGKFEVAKFIDLRNKCLALQDIITYNKQFDEANINSFEIINKYNTAKNTELKRYAILTGVVAIVGVIVSILFK